MLSSYVAVSKIQVVDTDLAVKRQGLAEGEEEVESIKRLVKAVCSDALLNESLARVLPLGSGVCLYLAALAPARRVSWLCFAKVVAFQVCLNANKYLRRPLMQ